LNVHVVFVSECISAPLEVRSAAALQRMPVMLVLHDGVDVLQPVGYVRRSLEREGRRESSLCARQTMTGIKVDYKSARSDVQLVVTFPRPGSVLMVPS